MPSTVEAETDAEREQTCKRGYAHGVAASISAFVDIVSREQKRESMTGTRRFLCLGWKMLRLLSERQISRCLDAYRTQKRLPPTSLATSYTSAMLHVGAAPWPFSACSTQRSR